MITVPQAFLEMPRWWADPSGRAWLDDLPRAVERQCDRWGLDIDGGPLHGSNALVVPVRRADDPAVLRLAPPGDDVRTETAALRHWRGRSVVQLLDVDVDARASLLERLDHTRTLRSEPIQTAVSTLGGLARRLAVPPPQHAPSTRDLAGQAARTFADDWSALAGPTSKTVLDRAVRAAARLAARDDPSCSVDGDLHFEQVLVGSRCGWTVVDPVLLRGDPEYDLGRVLWSRLEELTSDQQVRTAFAGFVQAADVPTDRARDWVVVRCMSYLMWGLRRGLTWDPPKCRRLLDLFG